MDLRFWLVDVEEVLELAARYGLRGSLEDFLRIC